MPEWKQKPREVYCPRCRVFDVTDEIPAICKTCNRIMITTVRSVVMGERIESQSIEEASKTSKQ